MLKEWTKCVSEDSVVDTTARCKPFGGPQYSGIPRVAEDQRRFRSGAARGQNTGIVRKRRLLENLVVAVVLSGGDIERAAFLEVLGGATTPSVA